MIEGIVRTKHEGSAATAAIFRTICKDGHGRIFYQRVKHNLRTNAGADWQALVMGGGVAIGAAATGTTGTAPTATAYTLTGVSAPGSTSAYNNFLIVVAGVWGVILSNTNAAPPVVTVDRWNNSTAPNGAAGSTPANSSVWTLVPAGPNYWEALTADSTAPAAGDTTLASEITTNGLARAGMTYSHTAAATSYALTHTFSCTGGSTTINKEGLFNAQNGGAMSFESAEPSPPTLISGDSLAQTVTINM